MKASDWDYFIISSLKRGCRYREIASLIHFSTSSVAQRVIELRKHYGASNRNELLEMFR